MRNKRQINSALGELANFESLTETFTEIAATRMQRVRDSVVKSRDFVSGINVIFGEVKANYEQEIAALKKATITNSRKNNGKTAVVFISANTGLYGDIVKRVFYTFLEDIKTHQADAIIIGKVGQKMLEDEGKDIIAQSFSFPDDSIDLEATKQIVNAVVPYKKVLIHYGKFESIVNQSPTSFDLTGSGYLEKNTEGPTTHYLVEPTLEEVLTFFETEIYASLFVQTVQESQLAKFASRMLYMDSANQRIKDEVKRTIFERQRLHHQIVNKKQLQTISSIGLWNR